MRFLKIFNGDEKIFLLKLLNLLVFVLRVERVKFFDYLFIRINKF